MSDTQTVLEALQELEASVHGLIVVNAELRGQLEMAERDNDLLRARVDEVAPPITDDERDLARDREREADFARSEEKLDRGARD